MKVTVSEVSKSFNTKNVLFSVSLEFSEGKIHSLVGENGAGKSTLAQIIAGNIKADSGTVTLSSNERISIVNQTPILAESLTALQNITIGSENLHLSKKQIQKKIESLISVWCPKLNLRKKIYNFSGDNRFWTNLIQALLLEPKLLILDEPCRCLDLCQRQSLYTNLRQLAQRGITIIVITHSITEAKLYTDTITVLEHGKITDFIEDSSKFDRGKFKFLSASETLELQKNDYYIPKKRDLSKAQSLTEFEDFSSFSINDLCFSVKDLTVRPKNRPSIINCSFNVKKNNITLIRGASESGLATLENVITGMEQSTYTGSFIYKDKIKKLKNKPFTSNFIRNCFGKNKTALLASNKTQRSSNPELSVYQLLSVNLPVKNKKESITLAQEILNKTNINTTLNEKINTLSGGMLQKLLLEKEISYNPDILILCEPLQGLDSKSSEIICTRIKQLKNQGKTILILSSVDFPTEYADTTYYLEGGTLLLTNIKENNHKPFKTECV